jgi:hypothetical protein
MPSANLALEGPPGTAQAYLDLAVGCRRNSEHLESLRLT